LVHDALAMASGIGFYAFLAVVAIVLMEGMRSALKTALYMSYCDLPGEEIVYSRC
jgi:hypothetical protein